jgi:subtilisin family serine protease
MRRMVLLAIVPMALVWGAAAQHHGPSAIPEGVRLAQERMEALPSPSQELKLSSRLSRLLSLHEALQRSELGAVGLPKEDGDLGPALAARVLRLDMANRVQVWAYGDDVGEVVRAVEAVGGRVERVDGAWGIVQAWVPPLRLGELAAQPVVRYVEEPPYPMGAGVVSQGDYILKARDLRMVTGFAGRGVKVGVISDGVRGLGEAQAAGELPPVNISDCNVVAGSDPLLTGAEGTAMLEIVHDLAPEAQLWFGHFAMGTPLDFNAAVNCLARRVDVIVDDVNWLNVGPYDGTSIVSLNTSHALNSSENPVRAYITAVGNHALNHYQERFTPCGPGGPHLFYPTARTIDRDGLGARCDNPILVGGRSTLRIFVQWDEPFGGACLDYNVHLYEHGTTRLLASSNNPQTCTQNPTESLVWTNNSLEPVTVDLVISGPGVGARELDIFVIGGRANFYTPESSVTNQADAGGGVISVGAINAFDPTNRQLAPYSSRGPTNDGRTKPEIVAVDGVRVSGAGGFPQRFLGTSAAAPHVAAVAALLLECRPDLRAGPGPEDPGAERQELLQAILTTATDLGPPGMDNMYGAGLLDALAAASRLCRESSQVIWGDLNCSRSVDAVDALQTLRYVVGLSVSQSQPCPVVGGSLDSSPAWGDVDCDRQVSAVDALKILRFVVGLSVRVEEGCPEMGQPTSLLPPPPSGP